jgi:hypothetical protein
VTSVQAEHIAIPKKRRLIGSYRESIGSSSLNRTGDWS